MDKLFSLQGRVALVSIDSTLRVMPGDGAGGFTQAAQFASSSGAQVVADFDRDGRLDLIFAGPRELRVGIARQQGF